MRPFLANAYSLLIDAVVLPGRGNAAVHGEAGTRAADVDIAAAAYRIVCMIGGLFERPRFRSAAFADRMARPAA